MKKKSILLLLTFMLIFSTSIVFAEEPEEPVVAIGTESSNLLEESITIYGMESSKMPGIKNRYKRSLNYNSPTLAIDFFAITDNNVSIIGDVNGKSLELKGDTYKSNLHDGKIILDVEDRSGNFEIIHASIFLKSPEDYDYLLSEKGQNNILMLYLKDESNNYFIFELTIPENIIANVENYEYNELPEDKVILDHWWVNVYTPKVTTESPTITPKLYGLLEYQYSTFWYDEINYSYKIRTLCELQLRDLTNQGASGRETRGTALMALDRQDTYYNGNLVSGDDMVVGLKNSYIDVKLDSSNNDGFTALDWDVYTRYKRPSFSLDLSYGVGPFSISYDNRHYSQNGSIRVPLSTRELNKYASVYNRTPTIREGDTYYLDFRIMETGGINYGKHYVTANFRYDVFLINEHTIIGSIPREVTLRGGHN